MRHKTTAWVLLGLGLIAAQGTLAHAAPPRSPKTAATLPQLEQAYADFNDAYGAVSLIDSDPGHYAGGYSGRTRDAW
jgi:hypothetical protein